MGSRGLGADNNGCRFPERVQSSRGRVATGMKVVCQRIMRAR